MGAAQPTMPKLTATALSCSRGGRTLFRDVELAVGAGNWLHVTGSNGAGKTTLLRTLVGLARPDHGQVHWAGRPLADHAQALRQDLVYIGHAPALKDDLTPVENLVISCALDGIAIDRTAAASALTRLGLRTRLQVPTRHLSAGQRRRALLARLVVRPARLWVLDEPFAALDTAAVEGVCALVRDHLRAGGAAVLTSHNVVPLDGGATLAL